MQRKRLSKLVIENTEMINCDFFGKHNICIHPALKRRRSRKCPYATKPVTEEWRCFFRLPKRKGGKDERVGKYK